MRVIAVKTLRDFWLRYPDSQQGLRAWYEEAVASSWRTPAEVKAVFANASILQNGRTFFNISGNKYRLVVDIAYRVQLIFIKFIGTHQQYDKIDAQTVDWED
jgi:mRNA interferase HigB